MSKYSYLQFGKVGLIIGLLVLLGGCEILSKLNTQTKNEVGLSGNFCENQQQQNSFAEFCRAEQWLLYAIEYQNVQWQARMEMINELDEQPTSIIKKILLSQGEDTPYQHRLRAQNWIMSLASKAPKLMTTLLEKIIYENSKQLLEFESAVTVLSRVNERQAKSIQALQLRLSEKEQALQIQTEQVEQLLKVETDLLKQNKNENR